MKFFSSDCFHFLSEVSQQLRVRNGGGNYGGLRIEEMMCNSHLGSQESELIKEMQ